MHDAYEPVPILEKLPIQIDCLAAWGECYNLYIFDVEIVFFSLNVLSDDWLLVGTKPGHLLLYRIQKDAGRNC